MILYFSYKNQYIMSKYEQINIIKNKNEQQEYYY